MEIHWRQLTIESISIQIDICQGALNSYWSNWFLYLAIFSEISNAKMPTLLTLCITGKLHWFILTSFYEAFEFSVKPKVDNVGIQFKCIRQYSKNEKEFISQQILMYMSHFAYACKTEGKNGISRLISKLLRTLNSSLRDHLFMLQNEVVPNYLTMQTC